MLNLNLIESFRFWVGAVIIFIGIDQLTKLIAGSMGWPIFFNNQFAFSLPVPTFAMYLIYAFVLVGMSVYLYRTWKRFTGIQKLAWAFVYAGGLSNICERLVLGYVRDFIPVSSGVLNLADFFIIIGLILMLISNRYAKNSETENDNSNNM